MADTIPAPQVFVNAGVDSKTIEDTVNQDENYIVTSRLGEQYPSLKNAIYQVIKAGGFEPFLTEADLLASTPDAAKKAAKALDTHKIWFWDGAAWIDTGLSELDQAKNYTNTAISQIPKPITLEILSGEDIYNKAKDNPLEIFSVIWQEYNKPVYHIGNGTFVDVTGVTVVPYVVIPELVFTIKLTEANQTFVYPTRATTIDGQQATIDWGDDTITEHNNYNISHTYTGDTGDEFQVKVKGNPLHFDFGVGNGTRRVSRLMLKSIDKNTMPKTMTFFDLVGCTNLTYLCRGAYSSWINTAAFAPKYAEHSPDLVFHPNAFEGLESVTDISNLFYSSSKATNFDIPTGLLDTFINATTANNLFRNLSKPLPVGILDKMLNLENVSSMFYGTTITSLDNRIFKNQTKLTNVSQCFRQATSLVADAFQLYTDMNQGNPEVVNGCFVNVPLMTNLAAVPAEWKTL